MRARKFSHVALLSGIVLGCGALWVTATPLAGVANGGVGGWGQYLAPESRYVAADWDEDSCTYCWGTYSSSCANYDRWPCNGGSISVAICEASSSAGKTTHAAPGPTPCWSWYYPYCDDVYDAACY